MLTLKGECHIGGSINTRTEKHGEENKIAMDIPCTMLIKRGELNKLLREDSADAILFKSVNGNHFEPVFGGKVGPIRFLGKFQNSTVRFEVGVEKRAIDFGECTVSKLFFDPQIGGMTSLKLTVQTLMNEHGKQIFDWADSHQPVTMKLGKLETPAHDEPELPFGEPAENAGDAPAEETFATMTVPKRVRKSRAKP